MIDIDRIEGFEWDDGNRRKSVEKHGVTQAEAEQIFLNQPLVIAADPVHCGVEARFHALGRTNQERLVHATFTVRQGGTRLRVISARSMSRTERRYYDDHGEDT